MGDGIKRLGGVNEQTPVMRRDVYDPFYHPEVQIQQMVSKSELYSRQGQRFPRLYWYPWKRRLEIIKRLKNILVQDFKILNLAKCRQLTNKNNFTERSTMENANNYKTMSKDDLWFVPHQRTSKKIGHGLHVYLCTCAKYSSLNLKNWVEFRSVKTQRCKT